MWRKLRYFIYLVWLWLIGQKPVPVAVKTTIVGLLLLVLPSIASAAAITVSWKDNSNNEDGFEIQRRTGTSGSYVSLGKTAANVQSFMDAGLNFSTLYCYRVRAFNANGNSNFSNEACASTLKPPPPAAPSDGKAVPE